MRLFYKRGHATSSIRISVCVRLLVHNLHTVLVHFAAVVLR